LLVTDALQKDLTSGAQDRFVNILTQHIAMASDRWRRGREIHRKPRVLRFHFIWHGHCKLSLRGRFLAQKFLKGHHGGDHFSDWGLAMKPVGAGGPAADIMAMRQAILQQNSVLRDAQALSPAITQAPGADLAAPPGSGQPIAFADALKESLHAVSATQAESNAQMTAYERGDQTDIAAVMLARQKASVAFEATMQVRNKLLSAYSDIMNMPL
jgi:flagellar hook-basal body complex protein FliE